MSSCVHIALRLPVPALGCLEQRAQIEREAQALPSFALVGNALGLVGVPDCVEGGRSVGLRIATELRARYGHAC